MANTIQDYPEKPALLSLLKRTYCSKMGIVERTHTYDELFGSVMEDNIEGLNCIPDHLEAMLRLFPDDVLLDHRIFFRKTGAIIDPKYIVAGIHTDIIIESPVPADDDVPSVYVLAGTTANRIIVRNNTYIGYLLVSGGSKIQELVVEAGSKVQRVEINTCKLFQTGIVTLDCKGINGVGYYTVEDQPEVPATTTSAPILL